MPMRKKKTNQPNLKLSLMQDLSSLSKRNGVNGLDGLGALISSINESGKKAKAKGESWNPELEPEPPLAA